MSFSLGGSKTKQQQQSTETYTPNAGFVSGVNNAIGQLGALNYQPTTQAQIDGFANPYLSQVGDATSAQLMRSRDITGNNLDAQAAKAGAFGGTGWGLLRGENNRGYADAEAQALAGINAGGYDRALGAAQTESQAQNAFQLQQLMSQLEGFGLLNYGTTNSTGKSSGSGISAQAGFKYGGG